MRNAFSPMVFSSLALFLIGCLTAPSLASREQRAGTMGGQTGSCTDTVSSNRCTSAQGQSCTLRTNRCNGGTTYMCVNVAQVCGGNTACVLTYKQQLGAVCVPPPSP